MVAFLVTQCPIQLPEDFFVLEPDERPAVIKETILANDEVLHLLVRCDDPRGTADEDSFEIFDDISLDDSGSGSFNLIYMEHAHYGCRDMCKSIPHEECVYFTIDRNQNLLNICVPAIPEREPDEI